jgi:uncharacterized protein (TIGR03067 family)
MLIVAAGLLVAARPGGDDAKQVQGTWDVVEYEIQGKKVPAGFLKKVKVIFGADKFKLDTGDPNVKESTFKLDPAKKPKQIEVTSDAGGVKANYSGIYDISGDTLRICLYTDAARPPTEFRTNPDVKSFMMVLKKEKGK